MAKSVGTEKRKTRSSSGAFFGGSFFGFIMCLLLIAGLGAFVYFKVSPKWINDTFNTKIDLGSEEINSLTLSEAVSHAVNLSQNLDSYTLNDLKTDFGIEIEDTFKGIDISHLKSVPLSNLGEELKNTIMGVSAAELNEELITFSGDIEQILNSEMTFYVKHQETEPLYKDEARNEKVGESDFAYSFEYNSDTHKVTKVTIKGIDYDVVDDEIVVTLKNLPLMAALSNFSGLKIADVMGFEYDETSETYYNDLDGDGVKDSGEEISSILNALAGSTIDGLSNRMDTLTLDDMFGDAERTGFFSLIDNPEKVLLTGETSGEYLSMADAFDKVIQEKSMEDLKVILGSDIEEALDLWIDVDEDFTDTVHEYKQIKELTLPDFIKVAVANLTANNLLHETNPNA